MKPPQFATEYHLKNQRQVELEKASIKPPQFATEYGVDVDSRLTPYRASMKPPQFATEYLASRRIITQSGKRFNEAAAICDGILHQNRL